MHCYHIKDWIPQLYCDGNQERQAVEDFINEHQELQICADIRNLSKHYELRSEYRSGAEQTVHTFEHKPTLRVTGSGGIEASLVLQK